MARGYDGNPYVVEQSMMVLGKTQFPCEKIDLHCRIEAECVTEMTILLDVGEYIPERYSKIVFDNVCRLSKKYAIVCWKDEETADSLPEESHQLQTLLSCEAVKHLMHERGFDFDALGTELLRVNSRLAIHSSNIQFFIKNE